jgi:hypothetical protein
MGILSAHTTTVAFGKLRNESRAVHMTNLALKHDALEVTPLPRFSVIEGGKGRSRAHPDRGILILGALLIVAQILDGVLTIGGVATYGTAAEGNPMLRALIEMLGLAPAVVLTKLACSGLVVLLCYQAHSIAWLPRALKGILGVYTLLAVIPWSVMLATEFLNF